MGNTLLNAKQVSTDAIALYLQNLDVVDRYGIVDFYAVHRARYFSLRVLNDLPQSSRYTHDFEVVSHARAAWHYALQAIGNPKDLR